MAKRLVESAALQHWVEEISRTEFGKPFLHKATFNPRLRSTGGRYLLRTHDLEFNPKQLEVHGEEEFKRIIRHELCHYHLHLEGRGYRHRDPEFKELLARVGGTRFCKAITEPRKRQDYRYVLICEDCEANFPRRKRMDPSRYRCGKCRGKLRLVSIESKMV